MPSPRANWENGDMLRIAAFAAIASAFALSACGGGGKSQTASPPTAKPAQSGGVVSAEPTKGFVGPATLIEPSGTKVIGRTSPISPKENRPTEAQQNGVACVAACGSTSANPSSSNLGKMNAAILCLLNAERSGHGLPPLHRNAALGRAAHSWANTMVARRFFAHEAAGSS